MVGQGVATLHCGDFLSESAGTDCLPVSARWGHWSFYPGRISPYFFFNLPYMYT
jgi:hypothetical protein